jgi:hypothetical protein
VQSSAPPPLAALDEVDEAEEADALDAVEDEVE